MSNDVSSRHAGDLGGTFLPFGDTNRVEVTVALNAEAAVEPANQHTAWMLINLLCRMSGVVQRVGIVCPAGVPIVGPVVPIAAGASDLKEALVRGAEAIGVVGVAVDRQLDRLLAVGRHPTPNAALQVYGHGWQGGYSTRATTIGDVGVPASSLPYGPYVAACLAAAEVFKAARLRPEQYHCPEAVFLSLWDHQTASGWRDDRAPIQVDVALEAGLAGVGAVGCAMLHTLWATRGLSGRLTMADADAPGLDATNLNRYALFGRGAVGTQKASAAAQLLTGSTITFIPHDVPFEQLPTLPQRVVSAVDRNSARAAIQNRYPARIFSASTQNLRAEALRCGPPGIGACLRCYNPPEAVESDASVRSRLLAASDDEIKSLVGENPISVNEVRAWAETGRCGMAGERLLPLLRREVGEAAFAVGFVSVLAGTAAAAELIKDYLPNPVSLRSDMQRFVFQFHSPLARSNRAFAYVRDSACSMCNPTSPAVHVWARRWQQLQPVR